MATDMSAEQHLKVAERLLSTAQYGPLVSDEHATALAKIAEGHIQLAVAITAVEAAKLTVRLSRKALGDD